MAGFKNKRAASVVIWIAGCLILWEIISLTSRYLLHDPMAEKKFPGLLSILQTFGEYGGIILKQASVTISFAFGGFVIGAVAGMVIAVVMRYSRIFEKMCFPYLLASQMIPILGLAPIIIGLCKDIDTSRIVISAFITFFPISVSLLGGLKSVPQDYLDLMRSLGAGPLAVLRKLYLPWALPSLFSGLKIAAPVSISAAILVDTLSARNGIGYVIIYTLYGGGTVGQFWPAIVVAALLGVLSFALISFIEKLVNQRIKGKGAAAYE